MNHVSMLSAVAILIAAVGHTISAENICNETVPANRNVDGFPAFAQCSTTTGAIYSNNGLDTRAASGGTGWIMTQGSGGYQCTEFAHRYLYFKWNVKSVPGGNAGTWGDNTLPTGLVKTTTPVHGDLIVFGPGSCGASSTTGHVAVVDVVNTNGTVTIVEENSANRRSCNVSCAKWFLHAHSNTSVVNKASRNGGIGGCCDVRVIGDIISIKLQDYMNAGATVCLYDLSGRKIAGAINISGAVHFLQKPGAGVFVVTVRKGDAVFSARIAARK